MTGGIGAEQDQCIFPVIGNYYREPLVIAFGKGKYFYNHDGREYLDKFQRQHPKWKIHSRWQIFPKPAWERQVK